MKLHILFLIPLFTLWAPEAWSRGYRCSKWQAEKGHCGSLIKMNADAGLGRCLPSGVPENIPELFARNNIGVYLGRVPSKRRSVRTRGRRAFPDSNDPRIKALARVVYAYDQMGGGALKAFKEGSRVNIIFASNGGRVSRRIGNQIQISQGTQNKIGTLHQSTCGGQDNIGLLAHELAHQIGRAHNSKIMRQYNSYLGGRKCILTDYSAKNASEQFAEVVAGYLTMPQKFWKKGKSCARAFSFLKNLFNEPNLQTSCESRRNSYKVDGNGQSLMTATNTENTYRAELAGGVRDESLWQSPNVPEFFNTIGAFSSGGKSVESGGKRRDTIFQVTY